MLTEKCLIVRFQGAQLILGFVFSADEIVVGAGDSSNQLIELEMHGHGIPILRVLDQEHHQEGDDRCAGVDDKLPGVGEAKEGAAYCPDDQNEECHDEREIVPRELRGAISKVRKPS